MNTPSTTAPATVAFVVLSPSGRGMWNCLLGEGATAKDAWMDAFGVPKKPAHARRAWVQAVTQDELDELRENVHRH